MIVATLLKHIQALTVGGPTDVEVHDVHHDSRSVQPGDVYVARRGQHVDGHRFIKNAIDQGAALIVFEQDPDVEFPPNVAWARVTNSHEALGLLASAITSHPSLHLSVIGITGTNGKTTTSLITESILNHAGWTTGLLGTVVERWPGHEQTTDMTTPEANVLQTKLAAMVQHNVRCAIIEVSSHALALDRTVGVRFAVASFTNLSQDHLDFHHDMESYRLTKQGLFTRYLNNNPEARGATIWVDDPVGSEFASLCTTAVLRVGLNTAQPLDVWATDTTLTIDGVTATVHYQGQQAQLQSPLIGRHNLANLLLAIANTLLLDVPFSTAVKGAGQLTHVPGRLQRVLGPATTPVFVDYAHSPDALENVLSALRPLTQGRLLTVFGCGGDRDRSKRPWMARATTQHSDIVYLTSDNPRSESPEQIIADAATGFHDAHFSDLSKNLTSEATATRGFYVVPSRRDAIRRAIADARPGDVVLIAGKGHEKYQEVNGVKLPFDDVAIAESYLNQKHEDV